MKIKIHVVGRARMQFCAAELFLKLIFLHCYFSIKQQQAITTTAAEIENK
jgi:hypothetical protein